MNILQRNTPVKSKPKPLKGDMPTIQVPSWLKQYVRIIRSWLKLSFLSIGIVIGLTLPFIGFFTLVAQSSSYPPHPVSAWRWVGDIVGGFFWYAGVYQVAKAQGL
jgi:hypothetical protein